MKPRNLWRVSVATSREAEEAVQEALSEILEQPASTYTDADSGRTTVSVYLTKRSNFSPARRAEVLAALRRIRACGLGRGRLALSVKRMPREDWAESWKHHFKPIEIESALLLKPSWSRQPPKPGQAVVILDPGLSFGTGQHPTTRFCLEQLVDACDRSATPSFLDIGTGSGILAIAAAKLGFFPIMAFDNDPAAVVVAAGNARGNGVRRRLALRRLDLKRFAQSRYGRFDVVCANLTADLLLDERRRIVSSMARGGRLILAGILVTQFRDVQSAYEKAGLKLAAQCREGEWQSGAFVRPMRS